MLELIPGRKPTSDQKFSICQRNLNNVPAHKFLKISLLSQYNSLHKFDIVCLFEINLDSSIFPQHPNLEMQKYKLIWVDHPSNVKRGEVCVNYKNLLPLKPLNINYLQECITLELSIKKNYAQLLLFIYLPVNYTVSLLHGLIEKQTIW